MSFFCSCLLILRPPISTLFPYTTLFRSAALMTNFWAPVRFLQRLGLVTASLGFFFNFSSWLIRWVARGDEENWKRDRKSTRLNSSHLGISYAVFCLKKKIDNNIILYIDN